MKKLICFVAVIALMLSCVYAAAEETSRDLTVIKISEIMAANGKKTLVDKNGESSDWIEICNTADYDVNIGGLCLSDGKKQLEKFVFPDLVIPAGGYIIVFCSGVESMDVNELHTSFKLSSAGEKVVLSFQGVILDLVEFDQQIKNISLVRGEDGEWVPTSAPTPGEENVVKAAE